MSTTTKKVRVAVLPPLNAKLEVREVEDDLKTYQGLVDGLIEGFYHSELSQAGICAYTNEEGLFLKREEPNFYSEEHLCQIFGTVVFVGDDGEGGTESLTDDQIAVIHEFLGGGR